MNRRDLFRGLAGVAGGLILPPSVGEVASEVERRYWALGGMPGRAVAYPELGRMLEATRPAWENVYTGFVVHVDREPYLGLQYVKVPTRPTSFSVRVEWVK